MKIVSKIIFGVTLYIVSILTFTQCTSSTSREQEIKDSIIAVTDNGFNHALAAVCTDMTFGNFNRYDIIHLKVAATGCDVLQDTLQKMLDANSFLFPKYEQGDCPVVINLSASGPSCVNGWDVYAKVTNNSDKEIKYVHFDVEACNIVGDIIGDKYGRGGCRFTGPLKSAKTKGDGYWTLYLENEMKRNSFKAVNIRIEYMDGTEWPDISKQHNNATDNAMAFSKFAINKYLEYKRK